jgi:hypothetical protein
MPIETQTRRRRKVAPGVEQHLYEAELTMFNRTRDRRFSGRQPGKRCRMGAASALLLVSLVVCPACDSDIEREFRGAAVDSFESGLNLMADGLLDGLFAVLEPNDAAGGDTAAGTGSGATGG